MKRTILSTVAGAFAALALATPSIHAQQFFPVETFDYPTGSLLDQGDWFESTNNSGTDPLDVVSGSLTYAGGGIPASTGNSLFMGNDARTLDLRKPFTAITPAPGNTYYYSMILQWVGNPAEAADVGDGSSSYICGWITGSSTTNALYRGIVRTVGEDAFSTINIGVAMSSLLADTPPCLCKSQLHRR